MRGVLTALLALCALSSPAVALAAEDDAALRRELRAAARGLGASSGVYVVDATERDVLYALRDRRARIIASNTKLFTTAATLAQLGPAATFETAVVADGVRLEDGSFEGTLYLVGGGDPGFGPEAVSQLADQLADVAGITRVRGRILGDESKFDSRRGGPDSGFGPSPDHGPLSALAYAGGSGAAVAATKLDEALHRRRVGVTGRPGTGVAPAGATRLAAVASRPLESLIRTTNTFSSNFYAEMLLKDLSAADGDQGTTPDGARDARAFARRLGSRARLADGSGLSRANRVAPREIVDLLRAMREREEFGPFFASLSIAGRTGTLALGGHRGLRRAPARDRCRGKTGTLSNVSAVSGYCRALSGDVIVFSIVSNGVSPNAAKRREDRMLQAIARHG